MTCICHTLTPFLNGNSQANLFLLPCISHLAQDFSRGHPVSVLMKLKKNLEAVTANFEWHATYYIITSMSPKWQISLKKKQKCHFKICQTLLLKTNCTQNLEQKFGTRELGYGAGTLFESPLWISQWTGLFSSPLLPTGWIYCNLTTGQKMEPACMVEISH